jgi:hypothetical protein
MLLGNRHLTEPVEEIAVTPRQPGELQVCISGQVNQTFQSRPLLPLALEQFNQREKPPRVPLQDLLRLDPELANSDISEISRQSGAGQTLVLCVNGNEAGDWREEKEFLRELAHYGLAVSVLDPRGVGRLRPDFKVWGREYADPLDGVEENIAYNAFLVGKSLLGMRVTDVLTEVRKLVKAEQPRRLVLCGRRDAALIVVLAAAIEPAITHVATEAMLASFRLLFAAHGVPIIAASILPGILERFGDVHDVLTLVAPRRILIAGDSSERYREAPSITSTRGLFSRDARLLWDWLGK